MLWNERLNFEGLKNIKKNYNLKQKFSKWFKKVFCERI